MIGRKCTETIALVDILPSWVDKLEYGVWARRGLPICALTLLWCWETWRPFFGQPQGRVRHAARNLTIAVMNTLVLGFVFGVATVTVADWALRQQLGLLHWLSPPMSVRLIMAFVLLDGWMYLWHRANHHFPLLWRFHRMHHSDPHMDATTATRFHLGELTGAATLRLGLIPLLGLEVWHLIAYDSLVVVVIMLHHADVSIGRYDRWLRLLIVSPDMHKVHHSNWRPETDSNYSTVFSFWDRLAGTLRMRAELKTLVFGLDYFSDQSWQSVPGMMKTPFVHLPVTAAHSKGSASAVEGRHAP